MKDTSDTFIDHYQGLIMKRKPLERLLMGFSMFDSAKKIVLNAIFDQNPVITSSKLKEEIFLRFYGTEFSESEKKKILNYLKRDNS